MNGTRLPFYVLQLIGLGCVVFFIAFWAITHRVSTELIGAAMVLILGGSYGGFVDQLRNGKNRR